MKPGTVLSSDRRVESPRRPTPSLLATALLVSLAAVAALTIVAGGLAAPAAGCSFCGRNLVKNPGAELGRGQNAEHESGAVPGWTNTAGAFGAASYSASGFWFSPTSRGPTNRGKNYFFGGSIGGATFPASVGTQTIKIPAAAAGHKATLSGWLGNYGANTAQVRAAFVNSAGKMLSALRIGPSTTIAKYGMGFRSRTGVVPKAATGVTLVMTFTDHHNANQAGADAISLVLS